MLRIIFLLVVLSAAASASDGDVKQLAARLESLERNMEIFMTALSKILKIYPTTISDIKEGSDEGETAVLSTQLNDTDLEDRVTVLETQMVNVQDDVIILSADLSNLDEDVEDQFIVVEEQITIILNEIFQLQDITVTLEANFENIEETIDGLIANDVTITASVEELDSRVTALEPLNGTVENISLEVNEIEAQLTQINVTVEDLVGDVTGAEEAIVALQQSDEDHEADLVDLYSRLSQMELANTFVFHVVLESYSSVPPENVLIFNGVNVNLGNAYNATSGIFTVPPGGGGLYYFYAHLHFYPDESGMFNIRHNGRHMCDMYVVRHDSVSFISTKLRVPLVEFKEEACLL